MEEVQVKSAMMRAAQEVIAVADCSKFNRQVFAHLCNIEDLDMLITDRVTAEEREQLENAGVRVLAAQ